MTDFMRSLGDTVYSTDAVRGGSPSDAQESAMRLSQQVNQPDSKKNTADAPQMTMTIYAQDSVKDWTADSTQEGKPTDKNVKTADAQPTPDPFDANKLATDLSQQMLELSNIHCEARDNPPAGRKVEQVVADKIHAELAPLWNQPEHLSELVNAMQAQGAHKKWGYVIPASGNPLNLNLNSTTGALEEIEDWRNNQALVTVKNWILNDDKTRVSVTGCEYNQSFN